MASESLWAAGQSALRSKEIMQKVINLQLSIFNSIVGKKISVETF
jgi:hypothetical protein